MVSRLTPSASAISRWPIAREKRTWRPSAMPTLSAASSSQLASAMSRSPRKWVALTLSAEISRSIDRRMRRPRIASTSAKYRREQREGDAVEIAGEKRARRGAADIFAVDEAGGDELELAEGLACDDMLDMAGQPRLAGRQHQFDDAARADRCGVGRKGDEDRVGWIAGLVDRLVGLGLAAGARLLRDPLEERRIGAAEQAHRRQHLGNIFAIHDRHYARNAGQIVSHYCAKSSLFLPFCRC